jgi:hypothetical protein
MNGSIRHSSTTDKIRYSLLVNSRGCHERRTRSEIQQPQSNVDNNWRYISHIILYKHVSCDSMQQSLEDFLQ